MKILTDKTGFPLIQFDGVGDFCLWPITKLQFERFMSETNRYGDSWYRSILELNPRVSYKYFGIDNYERLFMTGILYHEALDFAKWLGEGFSLPTVCEWRKFYRTLRNNDVLELPASNLSDQAIAIGKKVGSFKNKPLAFTFMNDGLLEWVRDGDIYLGLGAPRHNFHQNTWNPLDDYDKVKVINFQERLFHFGFRLIRR